MPKMLEFKVRLFNVGFVPTTPKNTLGVDSFLVRASNVSLFGSAYDVVSFFHPSWPIAKLEI